VISRLFALLCLFSLAQAQSLSWAKVKRMADYREARTAMADYLPDVAIPKLEGLTKKKLTPEASLKLFVLLGEAYLRNERLEEALKILSRNSLTKSAEATFWKAHTLQALGRLNEAADVFALVDSKTRRAPARLNEASIRTLLGEHETAVAILEPLLKEKEDSFRDSIRLRLAANFIEISKLDEATKALSAIVAPGPRSRYLTGLLQLKKNDRLAAIASFQTLTDSPTSDTQISASLFSAAILAHADSLALGQEDKTTASTFLLSHFEDSPASSIMDEAFLRLRKWAAATDREFLLNRLRAFSVTPAEVEDKLTSLQSYSLHLLGRLLVNTEKAETVAEGIAMLTQVLKQGDPKSRALVTQVHRDLGLRSLQANQPDAAILSFKAMEGFAPTTSWKSIALKLQAEANLLKKAPKTAAEIYLKASQLAAPNQKKAFLFNAGISFLDAGQFKKAKKLSQQKEVRAPLLLERGIYLSQQKNPAARDALERFISENPTHPRLREARLTLAESAVLTTPKIPELAKDQLEQLKFDTKSETDFLARQILITLVIDLGSERADSFLARHPQHSQTSRIRFELARQQQRRGEIGEAWRNLEELIIADPNHPLADPARLLSARAALRTGRPDAFDRAAARYQTLIKNKGPLAIEATLEYAQALNSEVEDPANALKVLQGLLKKKLPARDYRRVLAAEECWKISANKLRLFLLIRTSSTRSSTLKSSLALSGSGLINAALPP